MNPVVHFEMPYGDRARVAKFYNGVFDWKMNETGPEMGNYVVAETTETVDHMVKKPGNINGGFYPIEASDAKYPSVVIAVKDLDAMITKVQAAGGKVLNEPVMIPGIGRYVSFVDTEGNRVSMLQPHM